MWVVLGFDFYLNYFEYLHANVLWEYSYISIQWTLRNRGLFLNAICSLYLSEMSISERLGIYWLISDKGIVLLPTTVSLLNMRVPG